jgi:uncharacterized membrane protein YkoI
MMKLRVPLTAVIAAALACAPLVARAYTGEELASGAKVSIEQARAIALKTVHGKITDQELEKEPGGSGLRYSFDIKVGAKTFEVGVDARSGAILENKVEGPNPD